MPLNSTLHEYSRNCVRQNLGLFRDKPDKKTYAYSKSNQKDMGGGRRGEREKRAHRPRP